MADPAKPAFSPETIEWMTRCAEATKKESDRGSIIVGAAVLDDLLRTALLKRLRPAARPEKDELLDDGVARDFSARINLAYRTGVIAAPLREGLHLVRRMRNDVAHAGDERTIDTPQVRERLNALFRLSQPALDATSQFMKKVLALAPELEGVEIDPSELQIPKMFGVRATWEWLFSLMASTLLILIDNMEQVTHVEVDGLQGRWVP